MFWHELTSDQFKPFVEQVQGVCLVPLSVIERHGHHLPMGTDMLIGRELCRLAAELEPAVVFPDFYFAQILEARHVPGTIALEADLIFRLLENVCQEIARNGLNKIVLVSAHGGNYHFIRYFAQCQLASRRGYVVYVADPTMPSDVEEQMNALWETTVDGHAGESETSKILAIRPDLVQRDKLPQDGEGMPLGRIQNLVDAGIYTGIWWYGDHPTHYRGDGIPATVEKGEFALQARAQALASAVRLIKDDQETQRLQDAYFSAAERP